ncbi:MAG: TRAP transporter substrate-binding protein DctP [Candidatus Excrementavichristensenella sp.]|jgi:tripartite ATP-independent transporter DctP family solute receptor
MKKLLAILMTLMLLTTVALAEEPAIVKTGEYDASGDPAVELLFTSVSVTGDSHTTAMTAFADAVAELSGGSVTCRTYADGTLFSSENEFDAISSGQAHLAYISFPTLSTQPNLEWCAMVNSGYFWQSYEHMTSVLNDSEVGQKIWAQVEEHTNLVPLGAMYLGARIINTRAKAINGYADMEGLLLRMPGSEAWQNLGAALGANPTPLSFSELYTALSTGAVDAQDNPLPSCISAKFYEVAPYFAITNHVVDSIIPCINADIWNTMTDAQKQAVIDAMAYAKSVNDTLRIATEADAIAYLEGEGCTVTYPDIPAYAAEVQAYYAAHPEQTAIWDMDLYAEIQALAQ